VKILARLERWLFPEMGMLRGFEASVDTRIAAMSKRCDFLEKRNAELAGQLTAVQQGSRESAYLGEVSEIMAAMGPQAFKGAIATLFVTPSEVMQVRGESAELRDALANAIRAVEDATRSMGQVMALASRLSAIEQKILPENTTETVQ